MKFNDPVPRYTTQSNGDVTIEWLPPTPLMQQAQREVERLTAVVAGQGASMVTMQEHVNYLTNLTVTQERIINELRAQHEPPEQSVGEPPTEGAGGRESA